MANSRWTTRHTSALPPRQENDDCRVAGGHDRERPSWHFGLAWGPPDDNEILSRAVERFDLHAGVVVPPRDRARLERLCRYALRPPVAHERLHLTSEGQIVLDLRNRSADGTTRLVFDPVEAEVPGKVKAKCGSRPTAPAARH